MRSAASIDGIEHLHLLSLLTIQWFCIQLNGIGIDQLLLYVTMSDEEIDYAPTYYEEESEEEVRGVGGGLLRSALRNIMR